MFKLILNICVLQLFLFECSCSSRAEWVYLGSLRLTRNNNYIENNVNLIMPYVSQRGVPHTNLFVDSYNNIYFVVNPPVNRPRKLCGGKFMFSEWPVEANSGMAVEVENSLSSTVLVNSMYGDMISRFNLHKLKRKMNGDRDVKEGHGDEDDVGKELKSFCDRMITQRSIKWAVSRDKYYGYLRYRQRILDDLPGTSELLRALTDRREYPHVFFHNKDDHRDIYLLSNISGVYDNFVENEKNIFTCMFYVINGFIYTSEGDNVNVSDIDGKLRAKILPPVVSKDNVEVSFFAKDNCIYVIGNSKKKNDTLEIYYMIVKQVN